MSHLPTTSSKTLVAVAVLALTSGCATTADGPGHGGGIGDGLARAGQKTVGFGQTVWQRTGFLLGLHDDPGIPLPTAPAPVADTAPSATDPAARAAAAPGSVPVARLPLRFDELDEVDLAMMDEVDLAMLEEDAVMPGDAPAGPAAPGTLADEDLLLGAASDAAEMDVVPFEDAVPGADALDPPGIDGAPVDVAAADGAPIDDAPAEAAPGEPIDLLAETSGAIALVAADDLEHRVGETETLWDIAKRTTGDATNWHTLADVNDLGPGASVYPGQVLTIPADMLRPELAGELAEAPAADRPAVPDGPSPVAPPVDEPSDGAREFALEAGETLWDFARRTTGDATLWQAIAAQNGLDEDEAVSVREGQRLFVPNGLVKAPDAERADAPVAEAEVEADVADAPAAALPAPETVAEAPADVFVPIPSADETIDETIDETVDASAAALAGTNGPEASGGEGPDGEREIRIIEATYTGGGDEAPGQVPAASGIESVTISGTYYPKAVYATADFSAGLVMRVSPGTSLEVTSVDGTWYEVETERGSGWVHERDVQ